MQSEGFRVTRVHEGEHWWFRSRRDVVFRQVARAAEELGFPGRRLRLLDFGCGTGYNLPLLSVYGDVLGADRFGPEDRPYRLTQHFPLLDVERDLAAHAGRFDLITGLDVLEHLDEDVDGLAQIRSLLAPAGQVVLTVPAYAWLWSGEDVISEHRRRYTKPALLAACKSAGLRVLYASYFNLAILPGMASLIWARRLLRARGAPPRTNLSTPPAWINRALYSLTSAEAGLVGDERMALPAGASIICRVEGPS